MRLYEHDSSGNCLKVRILLRQLGLPYESVSVDLFRGETRTPEHFARNPDGRVPVLETGDGDLIAESGAILLFLAEGTPFLPAAGAGRARVHQWMFF
jgi:glutathione S-transferase